MSFGTKCNENNESPSAYTRITSHLHFIEDHSDVVILSGKQNL